MITNMNKFKNILKNKNIKPTYHRLKILEYIIKNIGTHPTAEMIYDALKSEIPTISMTTVYNTMNSFLDKGLVTSVIITGTEVRYDYNISPHHHFQCRKCGKIFDIDIKCPFVAGEKKVVNGHKIEKVHRYFKGICKDCSKSMENKVKNCNNFVS
jgi:Fur family peroxide stress response transcriptional regulator